MDGTTQSEMYGLQPRGGAVIAEYGSRDDAAAAATTGGRPGEVFEIVRIVRTTTRRVVQTVRAPSAAA